MGAAGPPLAPAPVAEPLLPAAPLAWLPRRPSAFLLGPPSAAPVAQGVYCAGQVGPARRGQPGPVASGPGCGYPSASELVASSPAWHVQLLRLLFQLVLTPALAAHPVRSLAAHTQLPVAGVRQVLDSLAEQGFWLPDAPLGTSPLLLPAPAHYWLAHYGSTLRRRLNAQRYRPRCPTALASWAQRGLPAECLWSGAAAAHLLLGRPEPPTSLTLYSPLPRPQLVQCLDLVPATKGPIEILNTFAPLARCPLPDPRCVPPLLVYADLLASQKPADEALAQALRAQYLAEVLSC